MMTKLEEKIKELGLSEAQVVKFLQGEKRPAPKSIKKRLSGNKFKFGVVSDSHLGSKYEALDELHTFYERCKNEDVSFMVHGGDMVDGSAAMHKGFLYELHKLGADEQIDWVVSNYPSGLETYYILGNHCESHFKQNGTSIDKSISKQREDLICVGNTEADVDINGLKLRLFHGGSTAYALSYPAQKYINNIQGGNKPNIIIFGHLHTAYYLPYRNIHSLGAGCFQYQSSWMRSKGINPVVGGWIVEVEHQDKDIISFNPKFIQFYK